MTMPSSTPPPATAPTSAPTMQAPATSTPGGTPLAQRQFSVAGVVGKVQAAVAQGFGGGSMAGGGTRADKAEM